MKRQSASLARRLRRNETDAEKILWRHLRNRQLEGFKFRRQEPRGRFVADFVCLERKLIVEVDGGHHAEQENQDTRRSAALERESFVVLRFWNNDVLTNIEGVLSKIDRALRSEPPPSP